MATQGTAARTGGIQQYEIKALVLIRASGLQCYPLLLNRTVCYRLGSRLPLRSPGAPAGIACWLAASLLCAGEMSCMWRLKVTGEPLQHVEALAAGSGARI